MMVVRTAVAVIVLLGVPLGGNLDANAESVSFSNDIRSLLSSRCFACHGPDEASREAGLRLDQPDGDEGAIGFAIEPGSVEDSEMWNRITSDDESIVMPPPESHLKPFNASEQQLIRRWIESGANYEEFWAFTPPVQPEPVTVQDDRWSDRAIDQYVLAKLESVGRSPSPEADPRTLIRRATFDLTGLPPTLEEIDAFVDAYEASPESAWPDLIDELISRPAFGEHFARYWLDLVRFADTNGMHKDFYRNHVAYRDWIIRAFNENLPYDEFVRYQLAGDLFDSPTRDQLVASGFNRLHLIIDRGTALPEESFTKNVIDRVTAVGTAFMGLTVQCAQCHDHKFDPITQKDFFSLYAFFNNIDAGPETVGAPRDGFQPPFVRFASDEKLRQIKELEAEIETTQHQFWKTSKLLTDAKSKLAAETAAAEELAAEELAATEAAAKAAADAEAAAEDSSDQEPTADEPTADEPTPGESTPGESTPGESTPGEPTPGEPTLGEPEPVSPEDAYENDEQVASQDTQTPSKDSATAVSVKELEAAKLELDERLKSLDKQLREIDSPIPKAMVMREREEVRETFVLERGQYDAFGEKVDRNTPAFLPPLNKSGEVATRMDLANWFVDPANPLTARVAVNRLWQVFFGVGITKTSEDFGNQGEVPSHPKLLDALAVSFVDSGWDVKSLVRSIAVSKTYRQASASTPDNFKQDPENRLLARGPRFRLDAEMIRDQILASSGLLSKTMFGPSVKPPQPPGLWEAVSMTGEVYAADDGESIFRRSVYTFWKRAMPPPQMTILNAPIRDACIARRERTNTPTQALLLLNEAEYVRAARQLAITVLEQPSERRMAFAWETITAKKLDKIEQSELDSLLAELVDMYAAKPELAEQLCDGLSLDSGQPAAEVAAWTVLTSTIYNLDLTKTKD